MISLSLIIIICLLLLILMICISYIYIKYLTKKLYNKHISEKTNQNQNSVINNKPLMIIGPSGVGKDTFMQKIIAKYPNIFLKCVSCTTRSPRENEKDGVNYFFITKEKFEQLDKNNKIIGKFEKYGNLYGTSKYGLDKISSKEKIVYFDYNIETAIRTFEENKVEFNYIALLPPSIQELEMRLRKRKTDSDESIKKRIDYAKKEVQLINKSDFLNFVIINGDLDTAFNEFEKCVKMLYAHLFE